MKKTLHFYYAKVDNMGDKLNGLIVDKLFGYNIQRHSPLTCEISGIGSGLGHFCLSDNPYVALAEKISARIYSKTYIWGSGFIDYRETDSPFYRKNMIFKAVRGELSKARCEKLLGSTLDIPTGDGGILAADVLDERQPKKYRVGVIAHYKEADHPVFKKLLNSYEDSCLIETRQDPMNVIRLIDQCELIISSSLHGLIIADSLSIPNLHIKVSDALLGDGFKFDDYYSAYGLKHHLVDTNIRTDIALSEITDSYAITKEMVITKREQMKMAFPFG